MIFFPDFTMMKSMKNERILSFDFIRALCALLIVFYHMLRLFESIPVWNHFPVPSGYVNGDWGHGAVVPVFFMLSGAALVLRYPVLKKTDLKSFYFKRWKSLFPAFYLVWFIYYVKTALINGNPLFMGWPQWFLPTVFGMDGYTLYLHQNYYMVGEWFLGAIILLYLLYPLLLFFYRKIFWVSTAAVVALFVLTIRFNPFQIALSDNLLVCLLPFWCGMVYMKVREKLRPSLLKSLPALALFLVLLLVPLNTNQTLVMTCAGILLFLFLDGLGTALMRFRPVRSFFSMVGSLSYEIFLVHHQLIFTIGAYLMGYLNENFTAPGQLLFFVLLIPAVLLFAKAVQLLIRAFTGTKFFRRLEGHFVSSSPSSASSIR